MRTLLALFLLSALFGAHAWAAQPTINSFTTSADHVASGGSATLTWTTTGATNCKLISGVGQAGTAATVTCGSAQTASTGALTATTRFTLWVNDGSNLWTPSDLVVSVGNGTLGGVTLNTSGCPASVALNDLCQVTFQNPVSYANPWEGSVEIRATVTNSTTGHSWLVRGYYVGTSVSVTTGGTGYTSNPTITLSNSCGTATTNSLNAGGLDSVVVSTQTFPNCTVTPTVTIGGPGTGAVATATDPTLWALNWTPIEVGSYSVTARFSGPTNYVDNTYTFTATRGTNRGFLALYGASAPRWLKTQNDGKFFWPVSTEEGFRQHCCAVPNDVGGGLPIHGNAIDNIFPSPFGTQMFPIYAANGFNFWRNNSLDTGGGIIGLGVTNAGNSYSPNGLLMRELFVRDAHAHRFHTQVAPVTNPTNVDGLGHGIVSWDMTNLANIDLLARVYQQAIDRVGWGVDIWELGNEIDGTVAPVSFYATFTNFFKTHDPLNDAYGHTKLTSASYMPGNNGTGTYSPTAVASMDLFSQHAYDGSSYDPSLVLDSDLVSGINTAASAYPGMPLWWSETGNNSPTPDHDPTYHERYRIFLWTHLHNFAMMNIFNNGTCTGAGAGAVLCIGAFVRPYAKIFAAYLNTFDPLATAYTPASFTLTTPAAQTARSYCVRNAAAPGYISCYLIHTNDHITPVTVSAINVNIPQNNMVAKFIDPATGFVLKSLAVNAGAQSLTLPTWSNDLVLQVLPF